jgi:multidrug transporter EmrE-like cation transporter
MQYAVALVIALLMNATANLLMKAGMARVQEQGGLLRAGPLAGLRIILTSPPLLIGLTCFALNAVFYMFALQSKALKISLAYPIMVGGGYAMIATVAYFVFRDRLTVPQWLGVSMILLGVCIVAGATQPQSPG